MKAFFAFFLFLVLVLPASAMNCTLSDYEGLCLEIQGSGLTHNNKEYLYDAMGETYDLPTYNTPTKIIENIKLTTDKLVYNNNEMIRVSVHSPLNTHLLTYGSETYVVSGGIDIKAIYPYNKISIEHDGRIYEAVFHVKDNSSFYLLFPLGIFITINYVIVALLKRYWGVLA